MDVIRGVIAIIFIFSFAIFIHEFGHFMFAKLFGVFVETFSIGFGKKLWSRKWGETDYAISAIPFGGYVKLRGMHSREMEKLLEEEEKPKKEENLGVPDAEQGEPVVEEVGTLHVPHVATEPGKEGNKIASMSESVVDEMNALRAKPYYQKFLIFSAGCINNFLTAIVVFFLMTWIGHYQAEPIKPLIDSVEARYAAVVPLKQGDLITKVENKPVETYEDFVDEFTGFAKEHESAKQIEITAERDGKPLTILLPVTVPPDVFAPGEKLLAIEGKPVTSAEKAAVAALPAMDAGKPILATIEGKDGLKYEKKIPAVAALGHLWVAASEIIEPYSLPYVGMPLPNLPAEKAGMRPGDTIVSINGKNVETRAEATHVIRDLPAKEATFKVKRGKADKAKLVDLKVKIRHDPEEPGRGQIGIIWSTPLTDFHKLPAVPAMKEAIKTATFKAVNYLYGLRTLFSMSWKSIRENIGGPVAIGTMTYQAANRGASWFFDWFALFNILLAVTNLLPLPVFDGGHIMFATIEAIIRRPLPAKVLMRIYNVFLVLIIGLALLVTANDLIMNSWRVMH
jgi:regulator of sigma E protease